MNRKIIPVLLVAIGLAATSAYVFAAQDNQCDRNRNRQEQSTKRLEHFDQRMAELHAALKLMSNQEATWADFVSELQPAKTERHDPQQWQNLNTPERLDRMLDNMKSREQKMAERAASIRSFYATLTPDQQRTFDQQFLSHLDHHNHMQS